MAQLAKNSIFEPIVETKLDSLVPNLELSFRAQPAALDLHSTHIRMSTPKHAEHAPSHRGTSSKFNSSHPYEFGLAQWALVGLEAANTAVASLRM